MKNLDSQSLLTKLLFKSMLNQSSNQASINTSPNPFFILFSTTQSTKERKLKKFSLWATFLKLSVNVITILKLFSTDVLSKSVSMLSTLENILKSNSSFQKSVLLVKTETKLKILFVNILLKDMPKVFSKRKSQETKSFLIIFILMLNLLNLLNLSLLWSSKSHILWLKVERLLPKLSEKFISNMKDHISSPNHWTIEILFTQLHANLEKETGNNVMKDWPSWKSGEKSKMYKLPIKICCKQSNNIR